MKLPNTIYYLEVNDYEATWPIAFFYDKKQAEELHSKYVLNKTRHEIGKRVVSVKIK